MFGDLLSFYSDWCGTLLQRGYYDIDLSRLWWNWEADKILYPNWATTFVSGLRAKGVRTLSYVNTFLANVTSKPSGFTRNFYLEAVKEGRFVMDATSPNNGTPWPVSSGPGITAGL